MENDIRELFDRCYAKAYRAAKAVCFDAADAEDAVAEALARLWRTIEKKNVRTNADGLFIRTAVREAIRILSKRREIPSENIAEYLDSGGWRDGRDALVERENADALLKAVHGLEEKLYLPIKLVYYGGFRETEAAELLGISYAAVKTRLHRARKQLKQALEAEESFLGGKYDEI